MLSKLRMSAAIACLLCGLSSLAQAQTADRNPGPNMPADPGEQSSGGLMSQSAIKQMGDYLDKSRALNRDAAKNAQDAPTKDEVMQRSTAILQKLKISCDLQDAELAGSAKETLNGKNMQTNLFEVACANGMGYFLSASEPLVKKSAKKTTPHEVINPTAMSCFAAEGTRAADETNGEKSDFYCQLPANKDIKAVASTLMAAAGTTCVVNELKWYGMSATSQMDYTEVTCGDGKGYLLRTALPGASVATNVLSCVDAAKKGLDCKMTDVGAIEKLPTIDTFKDYLAHSGVACTVEQTRYIGRETLKQRYVVEFKCPQQPKGLIAFIPLPGNLFKFETVDCAGAATHGVSCKLAVKN